MNTEVHIPSKGRSGTIRTGVRNLLRMNCNVHVWVEPQEFEEYCCRCHDMFEESGFCKVHKLQWTNSPSSTGSRNEILAWARRQGIKRIWMQDDNVVSHGRFNGLTKHRTWEPDFFTEIEQFAIDHDIDIIGPERDGFVRAGCTTDALRMQHRQYSCFNMRTDEYFRTRWNEDTDLALRVLLRGGRTCTLRTHTYQKSGRTRSTLHKGHAGGNSAIYDDTREEYAEEITKAYPRLAIKRWKWGRWHAVINWSRFELNGTNPTTRWEWQV